MPAETPYTDEEFQVVAAYHQRYLKHLTGCQLRYNWVFQEDFGEYYLIRQHPQKYVYVTVINDLFQISSRSLDEQVLNWHEGWQDEFRPLLQWEPKVRPDGAEYYEHHCRACGEGLQNEYSECMACGFEKRMLWLTSTNELAFEEHDLKLEIIVSSE